MVSIVLFSLAFSSEPHLRGLHLPLSFSLFLSLFCVTLSSNIRFEEPLPLSPLRPSPNDIIITEHEKRQAGKQSNL